MENNSKKIGISEVCEFLISHDDYCLLAHAQPDGDTIGACYALAYALIIMGKRVTVKCSDAVPKKFGYIIEKFEENGSLEKTVVALDVADTNLLGGLREEYGDRVDLCIDHHYSNRGFASMLLLDADASATCEIVYSVIQKLPITPIAVILEALYTGMVTDTGCFKYSNCTAKTHRIIAQIIDLGVDYAEINRRMFDTKSRARVAIETAVMQGMEFHLDGKIAVVSLTRKMMNDCGSSEEDIDGVNALSRTIEGVIVGITLREKENGNYKISLRTTEPVNASEICALFGGGGHPRAAGCEFDCSLEEAKAQLLETVTKVLEEKGCLT